MFRRRRPDEPPAQCVAPDDGPALVRAAKRNRAQFAVLYRRDVEGVYRFCLSRLGDREAAEDATSAIFERALAQLDQCRDETYRGWLYAIARSVTSDMRRADHHVLWLDQVVEPISSAPDPEMEAIRDEQRKEMAIAISQLPADQREVIALRLAGLKGVEIAEAMHKSHAAVRMLQFRATRALQLELGAPRIPEAHDHALR